MSRDRKILVYIVLLFAVVAAIAVVYFVYFYEKVPSPEAEPVPKTEKEIIDSLPIPLEQIENLLFRMMVESGMPRVSIVDHNFESFVYLKTDGPENKKSVTVAGKRFIEENIIPSRYRSLGDFLKKEGFVLSGLNTVSNKEISLDTYSKEDSVCMIRVMRVAGNTTGQEQADYLVSPDESRTLEVACGRIHPKDMADVIPPEPDSSETKKITVKLGQPFEIIGAIDALTFQAPEVRFDSSFVAFVGKELVPPLPPTEGQKEISRGAEKNKFFGIREGETRIYLVYNKPLQGGLLPDKQEVYAVSITQ